MPTSTPARILIVDDDPTFIKALSDTLRDEGHVVATASGGRAGIDIFQSALNGAEPFALVITDLAMNDGDGRQVATAVKAASPTTPVILMTGWGAWFETKEKLPLPVDCILAKPPNLRELRETLARYLPKNNP
jgi:DNA-binding response OmpR family regulator